MKLKLLVEVPYIIYLKAEMELEVDDPVTLDKVYQRHVHELYTDGILTAEQLAGFYDEADRLVNPLVNRVDEVGEVRFPNNEDVWIREAEIIE